MWEIVPLRANNAYTETIYATYTLMPHPLISSRVFVIIFFSHFLLGVSTSYDLSSFAWTIHISWVHFTIVSVNFVPSTFQFHRFSICSIICPPFSCSIISCFCHLVTHFLLVCYLDNSFFYVMFIFIRGSYQPNREKICMQMRMGRRTIKRWERECFSFD